jgi:AmmeMemoRadiSam system protein B
VPEEEKARLGGKKLGEAIDRWMDEVSATLDDPSFDALPKLVMAPQLDYWRGAMNFGQVYARLRVVDRPARVVILGSNNFGFGPGVVGCDKGFETPLGKSGCDVAFGALIRKHLGDDLGEKLYEHRFDHEREHSIELQMPWVQRVFGVGDEGPAVWAALVHDPTRNNGESYDGQGVGAEAFTDALRASIAEAEGPTLVIVSANLSHIGPSFGDRIRLTDETEEAKAFREKVVSHDRELLELLAEGKAEEVVASLAWQQNPTRWNSLGQIVVGWRAVDAAEARLMHYMASGDQHGHSAISTAAMVVA